MIFGKSLGIIKLLLKNFVMMIFVVMIRKIMVRVSDIVDVNFKEFVMKYKLIILYSV